MDTFETACRAWAAGSHGLSFGTWFINQYPNLQKLDLDYIKQASNERAKTLIRNLWVSEDYYYGTQDV
jgi:hypothetical protein